MTVAVTSKMLPTYRSSDTANQACRIFEELLRLGSLAAMTVRSKAITSAGAPGRDLRLRTGGAKGVCRAMLVRVGKRLRLLLHSCFFAQPLRGRRRG